MAVMRAAGGADLRVPLGASAVLHVLLLVALLVARSGKPIALPPTYRVNLVAAPPGTRQAGVVTPPAPAPTREARPTPPPPAPAPVPPPSSRAMPLPTRTATPTPPAATAAAPTPAKPAPANPPPAGGGPTGDRGTDVATVHTEGIEFPYPAYLENIVRQIAIRFKPETKRPVRAEVMFLIHRDGSVTNFTFRTRSGDFSFDLDAQGAVEAAANARAFGPLPAGFTDDVLPVIFSFDPRSIR